MYLARPTENLGIDSILFFLGTTSYILLYDGRVRFTLADSYERDLVISYSSNLRGDDKMEVVIPDNLLSMKSQLEAIAYRLRKHATKTGGKKLTTSLRLDDKSSLRV